MKEELSQVRWYTPDNPEVSEQANQQQRSPCSLTTSELREIQLPYWALHELHTSDSSPRVC